MKKCNKCLIEKDTSLFYKQERKNGFYINPKCIDCCREEARAKSKTKEYRDSVNRRIKEKSKDPDFVKFRKEISKKHYNSLTGRAKSLLKTTRRRSSKFENVTNPVDLEFVIDKLEKGRCEVTGVSFCYENNFGTSKNPLSPSIDRIDSNIGYSKENTRLVIWQYNLMKGELTDSQIFDIFGEYFKSILSEG